MVKLIRFSRDNDLNAWFAEIPEWKGDRAELEMVMGADVLLEVLAQGGDYITIRMGDEPVIDKSTNTFTLEFDREEAGGGYYKIKDHFLEFEIWLCHVTKFVFGYLPKKIYCKY